MISLGRPDFQPARESLRSVSGHDLQVFEIYTASLVKLLGHRKLVDKCEQLQFIATTIPRLYLLGEDSTATLETSVDSMMNKSLCHK